MAKKKSSKRAAQQTSGGDLDELLVQAIYELDIKNAAHDAALDLGRAQWDVDQDEGTIVFTKPDGITAICPVQIIGTYNRANSTWLWAWDNPSIVPDLQEDAAAVKTFGQQHGWKELTCRKLTCSEERARAFTALACRLARAQVAYIGAMGETLVHFTFGKVTLKRPGS